MADEKNRFFTTEELDKHFQPDDDQLFFTDVEVDSLIPDSPFSQQVIDRPVPRETEKPRSVKDMGFFDQLFEAGRRGAEAFEIDLQAYDIATGLPDNYKQLRAQKKALEGLPELPLSKAGLLGRGLTGAAQTIPGMAKGFRAGLPTAATAAGATALLGQAGPQLATPEEILTVPAAAAAGLATGSSLEFFKQGTGQFYMAMREEGVDHNVASIVSQFAGAPYALIELSQLSKIVPGIRQGLLSAVTGSAKQIAARLAAKFGAQWAEQVTEEVIQEGIGIAGEEIAKGYERYAKDNNLEATTGRRIIDRLWDIGTQAALTFGILQLPGTAIQTTQTVIEARKQRAQQQTEAPPGTEEQPPPGPEEEPPTGEPPPGTEEGPGQEEPPPGREEPRREETEPEPEPQPEEPTREAPPEPEAQEEPVREEPKAKKRPKPPAPPPGPPATREERRLVATNKLSEIVKKEAGELLQPKKPLFLPEPRAPEFEDLPPDPIITGLPEGLELHHIKDITGEFETYEDYLQGLQDNGIDPDLLQNDVKLAGYEDLTAFWQEQRDLWNAVQFNPAEFDDLPIGEKEQEAEDQAEQKPKAETKFEKQPGARREQGRMDLGVQREAPKGKIKTKQFEKEGTFFGKKRGQQEGLFEKGEVRKGTKSERQRQILNRQILEATTPKEINVLAKEVDRAFRKKEIARTDYLKLKQTLREQQQIFGRSDLEEMVRARKIKLRQSDFHRGKMREEMKDLVAKFGPGIINNKTGLPIDELASEAGMTEEQFRQELLASKTFEFRPGARGERANIFEMEEGDLLDFFEAEFGETGKGRQVGAAGKQEPFRTYTDFKNTIEDAFTRDNLEDFKIAFAQASNEFKVKYVRENRKGDAKKKAWINHTAAGAPLDEEFQPKEPKSRKEAPKRERRAQEPPSKKPPEPPPPRPGTKFKKMDIMAMVQMLRELGNLPRVNERLRFAYGRFVSGPDLIELKSRLLWDTELAEKVLGHEIGHFVDIAIELIGKNKQFAQRILPLRQWTTGLRSDINLKRRLREQAVKLSTLWRGPFNKGDRYRDSAKELVADWVSAMFNDPEMVNQRFPELHDAYFEFLTGKNQFNQAYNILTDWLTGKTLVDEWINQQESNVRSTFDKLMEPVQRFGESLRDFLKGETVSMFYRAFEKEGRPKKIGASLLDTLEVNYMWAGIQNELFYDSFQKRVQKQLDIISTDGVQAHKIFTSYAQAIRTIHERRAAGLWIENNPDIARDILNLIIEANPALQAKYKDAVNSAPAKDLYDLSAVIFREIHDMGERFVGKMAGLIDEMDLDISGEAALMAFNVRGKLLNPGGLTVDRAEEVLSRLRTQLTNNQWRALEKAADGLRTLLHQTQAAAHNEGLISDKVWNEIVLPNKDNYFPYAVLDYFEGKVSGGIMPQKGTAKDIADIILATQLKVSSLNAWRQRQRQVRIIRDMYNKGGIDPAVVSAQPLKKSTDLDAIRKRNKRDDISRAVIWRNGRPYLIEFHGDAGKSLEQAMEDSSFLWKAEYISRLGNLTKAFMQLYTTWSMSFTFFRNPTRGARTAALRVGFKNVGKVFTPSEIKRSLELARNYANAAFGGELLPEVRDLVDQEIVVPPRFSTAMIRDIDNLRELMESGGILAMHVKGMLDTKWPVWKGGKWGRAAFTQAEKLFTTYEAFEKIMTYQAALKRGFDTQKAIGLARRGGIPKPGVGGRFSRYIEIPFPWTRVHIQGVRSTFDVIRDPDLQRGFLVRLAATEFIPRLLKVATGIGVVNLGFLWLVRDDEDEKDPVMATVMQKMSPYKAAMDDMVPLMLFDPNSGQYHYFNDFRSGSEIPAHFEVVSLRVPASEEGRLWGTLLYNALSGLPGAKEKLAPGGTGIMKNTANWARNYFFPGVHPGMEWSRNMWDMVAEGKNPQDSFTGAPAANPQLFDAGGKARAEAIAAYTLQQAGEIGEMAALMAMNMGILDKRGMDGVKQRLAGQDVPIFERIPVIRNMLTYDNYMPYRDKKNEMVQEKKLRANAKLVMSTDVKQLYDFYYSNLRRKNQLKGADIERWNASSYFVNTLWGNLKNPNSYYAKAAAALEGSKQARETIRRDLDQIAAPALLHFRNAANYPN